MAGTESAEMNAKQEMATEFERRMPTRRPPPQAKWQMEQSRQPAQQQAVADSLATNGSRATSPILPVSLSPFVTPVLGDTRDARDSAATHDRRVCRRRPDTRRT